MRLSRLISLVGVLSTPCLALADTPAAGEVVPVDGEDQYFNQDECEGTATVEMSYLLNSTISTGVLRVFAQDKQPTARTGQTLVRCFEETTTENSTTTYARQLDPPGDEPVGSTNTQGTVDVQVSLFAEDANLLTCSSATDTVYVCVHFYPYESGTQTPVDVPTATAWGKLLLDTRTPATPTDLSLDTGDTRLYAKWRAGSGGAAIGDYVVTATPVIEGTAEPRTRTVSGTKATLDGLVNDVEYSVVVNARSVSGTLSADSEPRNAFPRHVNDFWEVYRDQGGPEEGGCGGPAGPLALVGLAAVAALAGARRRP